MCAGDILRNTLKQDSMSYRLSTDVQRKNCHMLYMQHWSHYIPKSFPVVTAGAYFRVLYHHSPDWLIDRFKTIEYFCFQFLSQNHCLFFFDSSFQKNLKFMAFPIVRDKGVTRKSEYLVLIKNLTCFRNQHKLFQ